MNKIQQAAQIEIFIFIIDWQSIQALKENQLSVSVVMRLPQRQVEAKSYGISVMLLLMRRRSSWKKTDRESEESHELLMQEW